MSIVINKADETVLVLMDPKEIRMKMVDGTWCVIVEDDFRTEFLHYKNREEANMILSSIIHTMRNGGALIELAEPVPF